MDHCPECGETLDNVVILCGQCGQELPLRVVVISEGSRGGGFVLTREVAEGELANGRDEPRQDEEASL